MSSPKAPEAPDYAAAQREGADFTAEAVEAFGRLHEGKLITQYNIKNSRKSFTNENAEIDRIRDHEKGSAETLPNLVGGSPQASNRSGPGLTSVDSPQAGNIKDTSENGENQAKFSLKEASEIKPNNEAETLRVQMVVGSNYKKPGVLTKAKELFTQIKYGGRYIRQLPAYEKSRLPFSGKADTRFVRFKDALADLRGSPDELQRESEEVLRNILEPISNLGKRTA